MPNTAFDPRRDGFGFVNDFQTSLVADVRVGGLCGGMVYASLDFFSAGGQRASDAGAVRPPDGGTLFNYIYDRQKQSILGNLDKWAEIGLNPFGWRTDEFFRWGLDKSAGGRVGELLATVGNGQPTPLGLFREGNGGFVPHHQVLAIGFDNAGVGERDVDFRISVYDPNRPGQTRRLMADLQTKRWRFEDSGQDERWVTYFVDRKYQPRATPILGPTPTDPTRNEMVSAVVIAICTGGDDLRGGRDNVDVAVITTSGEAVFGNVNRSARWIDHYRQTVSLPLQRPIARRDLVAVELRTSFGGGMGGENWNVDEVAVHDDVGTRLAEVRGDPLVRFTGEKHTHRISLRG